MIILVLTDEEAQELKLILSQSKDALAAKIMVKLKKTIQKYTAGKEL